MIKQRTAETQANKAAVDVQPAAVEEEHEAEVYTACQLAEMEAAVAAAERDICNYNGKSNGGYAPGNGRGYQRHNYYGNGNAGYRRGYDNGHQQNYNGHGGYSRASGNVHQQIYNGRNGGYGQGNNYSSYRREVYGDGEVNHDQRQQEGAGHYYRGARQGYRGGQARRQMWQPRNAAVSDADTGPEQKPEETVVSPSETDQKASADKAGVVAASGSEKPTGDAVDGECGTRKKTFVPKEKLSGSQKRKQKKKAAVDGSKKDAGNEMDKAKQNFAKSYSGEEKRVTLDEYEKVCKEKKKSMEATTSVVRKISAEEFNGLQLLDKKMADEEDATKKVGKSMGKALQSMAEEGATSNSVKKPDPKMVVNALFWHAPPARRDQDGFSNQYYRTDDAHRGNNSGYQGFVRGDYGQYTQNGASSGDYSNDRRGGYNGRGNGRFQGSNNRGYQGGYGNRSNGNGFYQERNPGDYRQGDGYRGRGNDRFQQRRHCDEDPNRANEMLNDANFPALSGTTPAPAPASFPAPGPVSAPGNNN